ncbi:DUF411 domain-containing protein [Noviherbaspirillum denitrificans]|uniref:Metal-binding protein n=1 Tax=Noviherbaspirillum denitrificans TaxID=1968433 RepID=A0A254TJG0_9BURK|nr:DUF411 domain-containing protein [Noviherbaspirillum denitrificans]OWW22635.1 metal-binding protein [Noviherbaspirillum denitrificans]
MKSQFLLRAAVAALLAGPVLGHAAAPVIDVYKSAYCGCCGDWIKHLESSGFTVKTHVVANPSDYREKNGIPNDLGSCHTGVVEGYAVEGHVPAADIKRLIAEKPKAKGLSAPGMPMGSPGMDGPRKDPYDVILVEGNGRSRVFSHHN